MQVWVGWGVSQGDASAMPTPSSNAVCTQCAASSDRIVISIRVAAESVCDRIAAATETRVAGKRKLCMPRPRSVLTGGYGLLAPPRPRPGSALLAPASFSTPP